MNSIDNTVKQVRLKTLLENKNLLNDSINFKNKKEKEIIVFLTKNEILYDSDLEEFDCYGRQVVLDLLSNLDGKENLLKDLMGMAKELNKLKEKVNEKIELNNNLMKQIKTAENDFDLINVSFFHEKPHKVREQMEDFFNKEKIIYKKNHSGYWVAPKGNDDFYEEVRVKINNDRRKYNFVNAVFSNKNIEMKSLKSSDFSIVLYNNKIIQLNDVEDDLTIEDIESTSKEKNNSIKPRVK